MAGYRDDLYVYKPSAASWEKVSTLTGKAPLQRTAMGFAAVEEKLFVFGGYAQGWNRAGTKYVQVEQGERSGKLWPKSG